MPDERIINIQHCASPYGEILLGSFGDRLCLCSLRAGARHERTMQRVRLSLQAAYFEGPSATTIMAAKELEEYFAGRRSRFNTPLLLIGSDFQRSVWHKLLETAFGSTISYGELARRLGCPKAVRAVANAVGANPLLIFAPCHRITGSDGSLTGYAGGIAAKRSLLHLESEVAE